MINGHARPFLDGPELAEKGGAILFHGTPRILPGEAEIQASPAINPGKSTRPGAEAMNEPGNGRKRINAQNLAFDFPGKFQGHRNILAIPPPPVTNLRIVLRIEGPAVGPPRRSGIIPRCGHHSRLNPTMFRSPIHACPYSDICFAVRFVGGAVAQQANSSNDQPQNNKEKKTRTAEAARSRRKRRSRPRKLRKPTPPKSRSRPLPNRAPTRTKKNLMSPKFRRW